MLLHASLRTTRLRASLCIILLSGCCRKEALKEAFTALMTADAGKVADAIDALATRLSKEAATRKLTAKEQLILRLNEQYPKVSCLSASALSAVISMLP